MMEDDKASHNSSMHDRSGATHRRVSRRSVLMSSAGMLTVAASLPGALAGQAAAQTATPAAQTGKQPNILVIWGDDIGWQRDMLESW